MIAHKTIQFVEKLLYLGNPIRFFGGTISKSVLNEIEVRLKERVIGVGRIRKTYGSNANSYYIETSSFYGSKRYFLKFGRGKTIDDEFKGDFFISSILETPKSLLHSNYDDGRHEWILYEYINGQLMSELFTTASTDTELRDFYNLENRKELYLQKLYKFSADLSFKIYTESRSNKLFYKRLMGQRFKQFYDSPSNVSTLFDKSVILNGQKLPLTVNQIIQRIKQRYVQNESRVVHGIRGHGDAHHGNIIVNEKICFIDNEYADVTTPFMEIAKPYYNDFMANLFFYENKNFDNCFKIRTFKIEKDSLHVHMECMALPEKYVEVTNIKLRARSQQVNSNSSDYISLNDYLFMCHLLTKNPNTFTTVNRIRFIVLAILLEMFNPFDPASIGKI